MNIDTILARAIAADRPTLDGWERITLDNLDEAVRYRLARLANRGRFDREFEHEEIIALQSAIGSPEPRVTLREDDPAPDSSSILLFSDGSLYLSTSGDSEVWADSLDFINERILDRGNRLAEEIPADSAEGKLIRHSAPHLLEA